MKAIKSNMKDQIRTGDRKILHCPECDGSGTVSDGRGSGEFCGCNAQRWEIKEFPNVD